MSKHNFTVLSGDTDAIMFCKPDKTPFSKEEQENLLSELNSLFPQTVRWEHDGAYRCVIVAKAKNYVMDDGEKVTYKGSAFKSPVLEPALLQLLSDVVKYLLQDGRSKERILSLYDGVAVELGGIKDISRWSSRRTISQKTLTSERANEAKVREAIAGTEYVDGDRIRVFFEEGGKVVLQERFSGIYDRKRYLAKLFQAGKRFEPIFGKNFFPNYSLKKNADRYQKLLDGATDAK